MLHLLNNIMAGEFVLQWFSKADWVRQYNQPRFIPFLHLIFPQSTIAYILRWFPTLLVDGYATGIP